MTQRTNKRAFSLIEVVIAVGIFAFAVVAIFGLMSVGLRSGRESANDLALGLMTQTVSSVLRVQGFSSNLNNAAYGSANTTPNFYFNLDGDLARDASGVPSTTASTNYYGCAVARSSASFQTTNAMLLRLVFTWPMQAPPANRQTRVVLTSMVNNG